MSDKLLEEHRARHKLPGQYNGIEDVKEHIAIRKASPRPQDVIEKARKTKGAKVTVKEDGSFTVTVSPGETRAKLEMAHLFDGARRLKVARAAKVMGRQERLEARGRNGKMVSISAANERELVRAGALIATRPILTAPLGLPRCQVEGGVHEVRDGTRCWWCGRIMIEED